MITDDQRRRRAGKLGSSDAAACLTTDSRPLDPWRTRTDLWAELTGRVPPRRVTAAMTAGTYLEYGLLRYAADALQVGILPDQMFEGRDVDWMVANVDGLARELGLVVECKTAGVLGDYATDGWSEEADGVPLHTIVQVHHQIAVLDQQPDEPRYTGIAVAALLGRKGLRLYRIGRNDDLVEGLREEEARFWRDFVVTGKRPPDLASSETLKRWRRDVDAPTVPVADEFVADWQLAKEARKAAEAAELVAWKTVVTALGDGERGTFAGGLVTFESDKRGVRTLRVKKPKRGRRAA